MLVPCKVVTIGEDAGFNVARHPQNAVLLQPDQCFLALALHLAFNTVEEMDLELGPSRFDIQFVYLCAQRLRVLVALLQVVGG